MTIRIINETREDMADVLNSKVNEGTATTYPYVKIYTGTVNGSRGSAPTGTLLATINGSDPMFATATDGTLTLGTMTEDASADDTGTAGCFAMFNRDNALVLDGTVTATGGGGDLTLNTTSITSGGPVNITGGTIVIGS